MGLVSSPKLIFAVVLSIQLLEGIALGLDHHYQDVLKDKAKVPMEMSEDYPHYIRKRRDDNSNQPLKEVNDTHSYYHTQYLSNGNDKYWIELSNNTKAKKDDLKGSWKFKNYQLKFTFPYYGHPITNLSVATGGFLYVGYVDTRLMMKVMYIAPLMAQFNTSINKSSAIYYLSTASQFTAQWSNVFLQNAPELGPFTFQCTLFKDGRIVFAYKTLPVPASKIPESKNHDVKIGVSDAFIGYRFWIIKKQIYKVRIFYIYHAVKYSRDNVKSNSSLLLTPLPNCVIAKNCMQCVNVTGQTEFSCAWCPKLNRCSDGLDRHRADWFDKSCNKVSVVKYDKCSLVDQNKSKTRVLSSSSDKSGMKVGGIIAIVLFLIVIISVGAWCFYAYTHPVSRSGLFLIDLRRKPGELFRRANEAATTKTGATTGSSTA